MGIFTCHQLHRGTLGRTIQSKFFCTSSKPPSQNYSAPIQNHPVKILLHQFKITQSKFFCTSSKSRSQNYSAAVQNHPVKIILHQNQHTRELISTRKTSHKHSNKDLSRLRYTLTWHASKYKVHKLHQRYILYIIFYTSSKHVTKLLTKRCVSQN